MNSNWRSHFSNRDKLGVAFCHSSTGFADPREMKPRLSLSAANLPTRRVAQIP
jgi:hypothetical protein